MSRFPDTFIEQVRERTDLVELIGKQVQLRRSGVNWSGPCPFHQDKDPSFNVRPDKGFYKCFGCGVSGDAFTFVMRTRGLEFNEAVEELAERAGVGLPGRGGGEMDPARRDEMKRQFALLKQAEAFFRANLEGNTAERARAQERFGSAVDRFGMGLAPDSWDGLIRHLGGGEAACRALAAVGLAKPRQQGGWYDLFRNRLIFPIRDHLGRTVGFGGRMLPGGQDPKYLNSPETGLFSKGRILYGLDVAADAIRVGGTALVVEGYADVAALARVGVENVVATMGTAFTADHMALLWRRASRVIFCFDGDQAGRRAAEAALRVIYPTLAAKRNVGFIFLPEGKDPEDVIRESPQPISDLCQLGPQVPAFEFAFALSCRDVDTDTLDGRAETASRMKAFLDVLTDPILAYLQSVEVERRMGVVHGLLQTGKPLDLLPLAALAAIKRGVTLGGFLKQADHAFKAAWKGLPDEERRRLGAE